MLLANDSIADDLYQLCDALPVNRLLCLHPYAEFIACQGAMLRFLACPALHCTANSFIVFSM